MTDREENIKLAVGLSSAVASLIGIGFAGYGLYIGYTTGDKEESKKAGRKFLIGAGLMVTGYIGMQATKDIIKK